jgi:hypothetical protein
VKWLSQLVVEVRGRLLGFASGFVSAVLGWLLVHDQLLELLPFGSIDRVVQRNPGSTRPTHNFVAES